MKTEIVNELSRLHDQNDGLRPPEVVDAARPDDSVLHPCFEWKDSVAGELYRQHQARNLIRSVRVVVDSDKEPRHVFCHVPSDDDVDGAYFKTEIVVQKPDMLDRAILQFQRNIESLQRSVNELLELVETQAPEKTHTVKRVQNALRSVRNLSEAVLQ